MQKRKKAESEEGTSEYEQDEDPCFPLTAAAGGMQYWYDRNGKIYIKHGAFQRFQIAEQLHLPCIIENHAHHWYDVVWGVAGWNYHRVAEDLVEFLQTHLRSVSAEPDEAKRLAKALPLLIAALQDAMDEETDADE